MDNQNKIATREDVAKLLASIGAPGTKREEKIAAIKDLGMSNTQGHDLSLTLDTYGEY